LATVVASAPRLLRGVSCGHDFDFHLVSWMETQRSWSEGVLYPHWAQTPNWDAGEPRFVFYPPLTWILGAALGYILNWIWVPAAVTFLFLACAGLATRALARQFLPAPNATLAGILAAITPYGLFCAYERTAFSELAAAAWIPLLLLFALRRVETRSAPAARAFDGSATPLALILAAVWLTNAPAGVMATYLLAFTALVAAYSERAWWPILRAAIATPIALGLAAFYLVPAAWEQRWIAIQQAVDVGMRIQDSWLFARHSSPDLEFHDRVLLYASTIFAFTAAMAGLAFLVALVRHKLPRTTRRYWLPLALLIPILFLLQVSLSEPVWNLLPKLPFLQFPWRWLTVLGVPYTVFLAAATPLSSRRARWAAAIGWTAIFLVFASIASLTFFQFCDDEDNPRAQSAIFKAATGVEGTDEYAPVGADNTLVASELPQGCLIADPEQELGFTESDGTVDWSPDQGSCEQTFPAQLWQNEHKSLRLNSKHAGFLILRLRRYPAWQIAVNGHATATVTPREDGLIVLPIPAGPSTIDARWTATPDVLLGRWISLASILPLFALWIYERQRRSRAGRVIMG
jgi:hypothetical protein